MQKSQTNIKLDPRLQAAYDMIPASCCVADIGCDHGKLAAALAQKCKSVIAIDKSEAPLAKAKIACNSLPNVECRLGDGLLALGEDKVDYVVIGGLSADTICDILFAKNRPNISYILIPASRDWVLRKALYLRGYEIKKEQIAKAAGRLYAVIEAKYCARPKTKSEYFCIRGKASGQYASEYLTKRANSLEKRLLGEDECDASATLKLIAKLKKEAQSNV